MAVLILHREARQGRIIAHTTLYLHEFDCRTYDSLQTSSLISYATMVFLEPGFMLIHTVIDLIWQSSFYTERQDEAAS